MKTFLLQHFRIFACLFIENYIANIVVMLDLSGFKTLWKARKLCLLAFMLLKFVKENLQLYLSYIVFIHYYLEMKINIFYFI